ncbi:MAG: hypothetical protein ABI237_00010 [Ginsengibacter sp.]
MTEAQIQKMKNTQTLILARGQTFWHYAVIPFLLITPALTTIDFFKYYVTHTYTSTKPIDYIFGYIWILPALIFYFIQRHRLRFKIINISVDNKAFHNAVEKTAKELEWKITQMNNEIVVAKNFFSWRSWGEQITILHDQDKILFNSICDPDKRPSIASFGMNKVNRVTLEKFLA